MKRQPLEWEKIMAKEATDKELISKIYKPFLQLNFRKIKDPIKNSVVRWLTSTRKDAQLHSFSEECKSKPQ